MDSGVTAAQLRDVLAGARAVFTRTAGEPLERVTKSDGTIVTRVDTAVNDWLRPALATLLPLAAWLSEESVDNPARFEMSWTWIVDPLDGTKELARGVPECAISIGLVHEGIARAGGVLNPFDGLGATTGTDGSWLAWSDALMEQRAPGPVETSISRTETEDHSITPYLDLFQPVRSVGSVANKLLRVACGLECMTVSVQPKSEWDICGGVALLQARGMVLMRLDGAPLLFNQPRTRIPGGFVAGTPSDVARQVRRVRERLAQQTATRTDE